jgi:ATP/maltotriose-dependent transcriptional regulator MalT
MFIRFLGRFFLYFYIFPLIADFFRKTILPGVTGGIMDAIEKENARNRANEKEAERRKNAVGRPSGDIDPATAERLLSYTLRYDSEDGLTDAQLAEKHDITVSEVRRLIHEAREEHRRAMTEKILNLENMGYSNSEIARRLSIAESEVLHVQRINFKKSEDSSAQG